jgi:formylglycine-generating enzyme required for sulfatase activity
MDKRLPTLVLALVSLVISCTTPTPYTIKTRTDTRGISQVFVPAGCFMMGSNSMQDNMSRRDEQPQHEVCITTDFWIDQYEVTNERYQSFVEDGGYIKRQYWTEDGWHWLQENKITEPNVYTAPFNHPKLTRIGLNWYEASAYAKWRGGQLPTEAQWEYAARGKESFIYPWGNPRNGNELDTDIDRSWVGAYQMGCNALEWISDWYGSTYYETSPKDDPLGSQAGDVHVLRGGQWDGVPDCIRAAYRKGGYPYDRGDYRSVRIISPIN